MRFLTLAVIAAGLAAGGAHAQTFSGSAVGAWSNPRATDAVTAIRNNDNTAGTDGLAAFEFGTANSATNNSNLLTFNGVGTVGNPTPFTSAGNSAFALGAFAYRNGTTSAASYPGGTSTVALGITLALTQPTGLPDSLFNYVISIDITPNNGVDPAQDSDTATIVAGKTSTTFETGGETYTLALLGFSTDNGATFTSTFVAPEETTSQATLFAAITTDVPEPATVALLGAGLFGLGLLRRRAGA